MLTKDDVYNTLLSEFKSTGKPVAFSKLKRKLKDEGPEVILKYLEELQDEGKVKKHELGGGKSFEPIVQEGELSLVEELKLIKDEIRRMNDMISKLLEGKKEPSQKDFDEAYDRIKDGLGYAPLEKIRVELGLTKEEFYSKFREYVESHYDLIAGGDDGFVRKGVIYGIVKRRRK